MAKPVVEFEKFIGWETGAGGGIRALLSGIKGHPNLGDFPRATTSLVERVEYNVIGAPVRLETLNTIYKLAGSL